MSVQSLIPADCDGRYVTWQGEHGVNVVLGQEIILVFTTAQQRSSDAQVPHSTAFPIVDGKLTYASTSQDAREFTEGAFKERVLELVRMKEKR